jgi:hypothetical protein
MTHIVFGIDDATQTFLAGGFFVMVVLWFIFRSSK